MVFLSLVTMGAVPILILSAQKKNEVRGIVRVATPKLYIYDAAVSVMTSALIQEAVLSTLEYERDWNYKEYIFMGGRTKKPTWIRKQDFCDICNGR